VLRLIFAFVEIALHRRGPDDLPASRFLFAVVLVAYLIAAFATLRLGAGVAHPILLLIVDTAFSLTFIWSVLKAFDHERRFKQTASALLGTDTLLNVMSMPLIVWSKSLEGTGGDSSLVAILFALLAIWSIDISGFVLSRALDRAYFLGVAIMLGYVLLSISLRLSLFPAPT
jgi:hypothetical protein